MYTLHQRLSTLIMTKPVAQKVVKIYAEVFYNGRDYKVSHDAQGGVEVGVWDVELYEYTPCYYWQDEYEIVKAAGLEVMK